MRTTKTIELSKQSLKQAKEYLNKYVEAYEKGLDNAVEYATNMMYEKVKQYCYDNGIEKHTNNISMEYDATKKLGRVFTNDMVIIFNEMGTGIVGKNNPHPSPAKEFKGWMYDVNNHGERGWRYPKDDGTYGRTRGLPSRHMFYSAFNDIKDEIGDIVDIQIIKTVGDLY